MNALKRFVLDRICPLIMVSALAVAIVAGDSSRAADAPPNIMVFLVDDMGVMDTSVPSLLDGYGHPRRYPLNDYYRTPGMERLAAQAREAPGRATC